MGRLAPFEENTIVCGDVIEVLSQSPDACVDAIVTDPPYGLEFMGKEWDSFKGDNVIMPPQGAYEHKKGFDKMVRHLSDRDGLIAYQSWTTSWATEAYRILKPGAYMLVMGGTRTHHRLGVGLEDAGFEILDELAWIHSQGFPKNYDVSKGIDKRAGAEREAGVIRRGAVNPRGYKSDGINDSGGPYQKEFIERNNPATPEARYWEGYGTALKPAHEPIWLCKKPNEGSYVDNVLKHGVGAMNINGCRVEYQSPDEDTRRVKSGWQDNGYVGGKYNPTKYDAFKARPLQGRWPANVIVDCYPEEFQGGVVIEGAGRPHQPGRFKSGGPGTGEIKFVGPSFEQEWPEEPAESNGLLREYTRFFVIPKPSKAEKTCNGRVENKHVTVKPVRLGKWLIKLITPHQHPVVLLDPFCGSGSFLVAAQELNYEGYQIEFYGIDKDGDSVKTALARLEKDRAARQMELL